jgi:hypothetical protein
MLLLLALYYSHYSHAEIIKNYNFNEDLFKLLSNSSLFVLLDEKIECSQTSISNQWI